MRLFLMLAVALGMLVVLLNPGGMIKWLQSDDGPSESVEIQTHTRAQKQEALAEKETRFKNELAKQVSVVAKRYEETMRFPSYSIPINAGQTDLLEPLPARPVALNIDPEARSQAALTADDYIFFQGEAIKATLSTSGSTRAENVTLVLVHNNEPLASFKVNAEEKTFVGVLENTEAHWPVDLHIRADFNFGEYGKVSILSPIKYSPNNGRVKSVGDAFVDGVNLAIPIELEIEQAGRYRLSANLFDQSNQPLAHLNSKQNLKVGNNIWQLNVHSEVLRSANLSGPYWLDTIQLTKLPERPGISTSYGKSDVGRQAVNGFPLSEYDDTPWQDPKDKARLEFLKKLQN